MCAYTRGVVRVLVGSVDFLLEVSVGKHDHQPISWIRSFARPLELLGSALFGVIPFRHVSSGFIGVRSRHRDAVFALCVFSLRISIHKRTPVGIVRVGRRVARSVCAAVSCVEIKAKEKTGHRVEESASPARQTRVGSAALASQAALNKRGEGHVALSGPFFTCRATPGKTDEPAAFSLTNSRCDDRPESGGTRPVLSFYSRALCIKRRTDR